MRDDLFEELLESIEEAGEIRAETKAAARHFRYVGKILVEIEEGGETVWTLQEAAQRLRSERSASATPRAEPNPKILRDALHQSQEGFAELLGISVRTLQNWEQGRREPDGSAKRLLDITARHPSAVLDVAIKDRAA